MIKAEILLYLKNRLKPSKNMKKFNYLQTHASNLRSCTKLHPYGLRGKMKNQVRNKWRQIQIEKAKKK